MQATAVEEGAKLLLDVNTGQVSGAGGVRTTGPGGADMIEIYKKRFLSTAEALLNRPALKTSTERLWTLSAGFLTSVCMQVHIYENVLVGEEMCVCVYFV